MGNPTIMRPNRHLHSVAVLATVLLAAAAAPARADGDAAAGEKLFRQCRSCHATEAGKHRVGPSLHAVVGRTAGTVAGFANYSEGLKSAGFPWDATKLDAYLTNPKAMIPDSRMSFAGVPAAQDRADLIAYLSSLTK